MGFAKYLVSCVSILVAAQSWPAEPGASTAARGTNWLHLGGNAESQQYSELHDINASNVKQLGLLWYSEIPIKDGLVGNPLIKDGVVYQSGPRGNVFANDAATGRLLWKFAASIDYSNRSAVAMYATHSNRGLAIDDTNVYFTSGDCQVYAIDQHNGAEIWHVQSCDPTRDYGVIAAPRVGGGKVFVGQNNQELGTERGFLDAFDAKTGKHEWRFYTTPGDPSQPFENDALKMAAKTWSADHWQRTHSGVSVWDGMTYDPKTNLIIFGTGSPTLIPSESALDTGDELFTDSIVAVNASTGAYVWHFQLVQHDGWNYDGVAHLVLADLPISNSVKHVVMSAAKSGYFYVLDAEKGTFVSGNPYVPNSVFSSIDPKTGRLAVRDEANYWKHPERSFVQQPGSDGGHSWALMAYNPATHLVYIPGFVHPRYVPAKGEVNPPAAHEYGFLPNAQYKSTGKLIAWDPIARKERWHVDNAVVIDGGVLTTAGNIVLQGTPDGKTREPTH